MSTNTCQYCAHWSQGKEYGPVISKTPLPDVNGDMFPEGFRKLLKALPRGACKRFKKEWNVPNDEVTCLHKHTSGMGESDGGYLETGKDFGCIHFTPNP